jgi:hypothetical protein
MAVVKRPGTPEALLEDSGAPERITPPRNVVDINAIRGAATMAKKASKTGTYKVGDDYFHYNEGDVFPEYPDGLEAQFHEAPINATEDSDVVTPEQPDERDAGAAPQNRARGTAPSNR